VLLYQLLATVDNAAERVKNDGRVRPSGLSQSRVISLAVDFIEKNFSSPITLAQVCEACGGISEQYLCRQFKKSYGLRPFEYILNMRIRYAKFLLAQTGEPISTVAERSGFEHISYFYKKWRCFEETSPTKWRNEHKNAFV
jgi:AraC-like DNA-binding protein